MVASAASLLLRYAGRSLQRPIPRALEELRLSPRGLKDSPRRLYSSDGVGTKSQPDSQLFLLLLLQLAFNLLYSLKGHIKILRRRIIRL
uniref:Uncharacterized protein n=1 Tax=Oryza barthii TaxID=65489 RepID=A0A0D3H4P5_9ORYZ